MKKDLKSVILKVAKFLEKTLTEQDVNKLLDHLSFDSIKLNPFINVQPIKNTKTGPNDQLVRKGIVGDHKNHMSLEMIKEFDEWTKKNNKNNIMF